MRDDNCIFCKIANGEIPAATLYEDEDFRVILDLGPAAKGHALILPKEHAANLFELPDELDLSGETVYIIDNDIHHITDYLETVGFTADRDRCEGFAVVVKDQ